MIFPNDKISCNHKKIEQIKRKQKNVNKIGNKSTKKSENSKDSQSLGSAASDHCDKNFYSKSLRGSQDRFLMSAFAHKLLAPDTSEELLELVRNVSDFSEQKPPCEDKSPSPVPDNKSESSFQYKYNISKNDSEKNEKLKTKEAEDFNLKESMKRAKMEHGETPFEKEKSVDLKRRQISREKKEKNSTEQEMTNHQGDSRGKIHSKSNKSLLNERFDKITAFKDARDSKEYILEDNTQKSEKQKSHKVKMLRPSEIPLWKNRTKFSRKAKHISLLMENPVKETESALSLDFCFKKPCSPIEEVSICSEGQSEEKVTVKYRNQRKEMPTTSDNTNTVKIPLEDKITEENIGDNVLLNRCNKTSNIPLVSELFCYELTEKQSKTGHKVKLVDLEMEKSASATALTDTNAFFGLETIHQKKEITAEDEKLDNFGKNYHVPVFSALVEKNSKKNLSNRLNCKENKHILKTKTKKGRTELLMRTSQAAHKTTNENVKFEKQFLPSGKILQISSSEARKDFQGSEETKEALFKKFSLKGKSLQSKDSNKKAANSYESGKKACLSSSKERKQSQTTNDSDFENYGQKSFHTNEDLLEESNRSHKVLVSFSREMSPSTPLEKTRQQAANSVQSSEKKIQKLGNADKSPIGYTNLSQKSEEGKRVEAKSKTAERKSKDAKMGKNEKESSLSGVKLEDLSLKGTSLSVFVSNGLNNNTESNHKLDIDCEIPSEAKLEPVNAFEWLYLNYKKCSEQLYKNVTNICSLDAIQIVEDERDKIEGLKLECSKKKKEKEEGTKSESEKESADSESNALRKKKKVKSAPVDRRNLSSEEQLTDSHEEIKKDSQQRRVLTKSTNQDPRPRRNEAFEAAKGMTLKRRASEPDSFRGFLWKRADTETPKGNKASVSSVASSLRHLNTDELEDFIFWEAVPQSLTACWETSLYHLKRPWSVLSCAVFKYNRESSTPGIILSNLRKGSDKNIRQPIPNEKLTNRTKNSFDIEPSIAQKNIDIKNWLAALNFPTAPSTPYETINEGDFNTRFPPSGPSLNKSMIPTKQKKPISKSKFTDEIVDKKQEEKKKFKEGKKWDSGEMGSLKDLVRRKSGGFVTCEQFLNPELPSTTVVNCCTYSHSVSADKVSEELDDALASSVTERGEGVRKNPNDTGNKSNADVIKVKKIEVLKEVETRKEPGTEEKVIKTTQPRSNPSTARPFDNPTHPIHRAFKQLLLILGCMIGVFFMLQFADFDIDSLM